LTDRPEIIALTKVDGLDDEMIQMQIDTVRAVAGKTQVLAISSSAHKGLTEVLRVLNTEVVKSRQVAESVDDNEEEIETISLSNAKIAESWKVDRVENEDGKIYFVVTGEKIEKFARTTNFGHYEAENRLRDIMKKMGIAHELRRRGAEGNSIIKIGNDEFTFLEQ
jgi:GTP-binding protein